MLAHQDPAQRLGDHKDQEQQIQAGLKALSHALFRPGSNCRLGTCGIRAVDSKPAAYCRAFAALLQTVLTAAEAAALMGHDIKERYAAILEARKLMAEAGKKHTKTVCPHCRALSPPHFLFPNCRVALPQMTRSQV